MAYLLPHLLEAQAARNPEQLAVICRDCSLTYAELEAAANRLARILLGCGVSRGHRVGVLLHKSVEVVVSIYAILKAGAAYVPLHPLAPPQRLSYVLRDCDPKVLITEHSKLKALGQVTTNGTALKSVILREETVHGDSIVAHWAVDWLGWESVRTTEAGPANSEAIGDDLAYVIYTSGSTGRPKGVMVSHRNVLAWVNWGAPLADVSTQDRIGNYVPFCFDLSAFDTFAAAWGGASLILIPEEIALLPVELARFLDDQGISIIYWTPSTLVRLLQQGNLEQRNLQQLRTVFFAGEVFPTRFLRKWMELVPQASFFNLYGSTEVCACTYCTVSSLPADDRPVPIGKACDDVDVFAVDERGSIIAPGEVGELLVRGATVMKGYWNDPEKTRAVLCQNPLHDRFTDPVYWTGDLVTLDADGLFHFFGRKDRQVKSRGYRIELDEIEATILNHPEVAEVAAIAIPDEVDTNRVFAYAVSTSEQLSVMTLIQHCRKCLPSYMLPASIILVPSLPRTLSGKIDRQSLLDRHPSRSDSSRGSGGSLM